MDVMLLLQRVETLQVVQHPEDLEPLYADLELESRRVLRFLKVKLIQFYLCQAVGLEVTSFQPPLESLNGALYPRIHLRARRPPLARTHLPIETK